MQGNREIGRIDARFAEQREPGGLCFTLAARTWRAVHIDWKYSVVRVEPTTDRGQARWHGWPYFLHRALCRAVREVLAGEQISATWSRRARERIAELRTERGVSGDMALELQRDANGYRLWTFAGGLANNLLASLLESELGERVTADNYYVGLRRDAARSTSAIVDTVRALRDAGRPTNEDAARFASTSAHGRLSKFQPCLPEELEARYLASVLTDPHAARAILHEPLRIDDQPAL